jgi:hypothetical protein
MRELNNLPTDTTDDELEVRLHSYARRAFDYAAEAYGIRVGDLASPATKSVAHFNADISGARTLESPEVWDRLLGGLQFLRVIAVNVERQDVWAICDGLVGKAMNDAWSDIRDNMQRLSVEELQPTFEAWCRHVAWSGGEPADPLAEIRTQMAFDELGIKDPLKHRKEIEEFRQQEEAEVRERAGTQLERQWGVIVDGQRW